MNAIEIFLRKMQQKMRGVKRRWKHLFRREGIEIESGHRTPTSASALARLNLQVGEYVRIKPLEQIQATLDDNNCYKGLEFMAGMSRYCGQVHRVFKRVKYMYDEHKKVMLKCKDNVLLENLICDGKDMWNKEGCDRCCFYFWKEQWLERVDNAEYKSE